ncbi:MAG: primosome assembly protein PriA [Propionicimonas sp.]
MEQVRLASVAVDVPLANLDRPFDYLVPEAMAEAAVVGARVRVRFAGRLRNGFIVELRTDSPRDKLLPLQGVLSPEPVLTAEVTRLVRAVADHYASSFADVVRLAVPPRHALTERATPPDYPQPRLESDGGSVLAGYPAGDGYLKHLATGGRPRAAWTVVPRPDGAGDWAGGLLDVAAATLESGRGVVLVVPDARDLAALSERATERFGAGSFVTLTAELGPAARYRAFLAAARGQVRLVLGNRAAVFAPVHDLGLIALWDDGDDSYAEPRAPYPHAREVAALRAHLAGSGLLLAARSRTAEVQRLVATGWLHPIQVEPHGARAAAAAVRVTRSDDQRLPPEVFATIRAGLAHGPVLVSVPRSGYQPRVVCAGCLESARCPSCQQALHNAKGGLTCPWCGPPLPQWRCPECGDRRVRAPIAGVLRTAEEFGKAFPGVRVLSSSGEHPLAPLADDEPVLVLSTPGVEPSARFGYAAAVLLDTAATLSRPELRAGEEALRRWLAVTALVRPGEDGGTVLVVGEAADRQVQALLRLDPVGYAERELAERTAAGFPPAIKLVTLEGDYNVLHGLLKKLELPGQVQVNGPFETAAEPRVTLRCALPEAPALVGAVRTMLSQRAAAKAPGALRVRVDPQVVG